MTDRRQRPRSPPTSVRSVRGTPATAASDGGPAPLSATTLRLFTVSDGAAPAEDSSMRQPSLPAKNPRWLQQREKELRSEAIRERMHDLIAQIEVEEARERPALRKAWLHEKKMELRRLSFKQPEDIIAAEGYMRRARRKLREARRRRREKDGEDEDEEDEDDGSSRSSSSEGGGKAKDKDKEKDKDEDKDNDEDKDKDKRERNADKRASDRSVSRGAASAARKKPGRNGRGGGDHSGGEDNDATSGAEDGDDDSESGGVFNLNPTGRRSRPNPRAPSLPSEVELGDASKKQKSLARMGKIIRFPLESGFKLGRKIRKHREKRKASSAHGSSTGGGADGDSDNAEAEWGERVDTGQRRLERRRRSSTSEADIFRRCDANVRVIVTGDSDGDNNSSGSSDGGADKIPELQESVGKKIRDRLAIRRPRWRSRNNSDSEGDGEDDGGGANADGEGNEAGKNKKKKEKGRKDKEKKAKDKMDRKKEREMDERHEEEHSDEAKDKQKKSNKKDKKQKKSKEKDSDDAAAKKQSDAKRKAGQVNTAVEFVELEDD